MKTVLDYIDFSTSPYKLQKTFEGIFNSKFKEVRNFDHDVWREIKEEAKLIPLIKSFDSYLEGKEEKEKSIFGDSYFCEPILFLESREDFPFFNREEFDYVLEVLATLFQKDSFYKTQTHVLSNQNRSTKHYTSFIIDNKFCGNFCSFIFNVFYALVKSLKSIEDIVNKQIQIKFEESRKDHVVSLLYKADQIEDYTFKVTDLKFPLNLSLYEIPLYTLK